MEELLTFLAGAVFATLLISLLCAVATLRNRIQRMAGPEAVIRAALERVLERAGRGLPDDELEQHALDRDLVRAGAEDWFR